MKEYSNGHSRHSQVLLRSSQELLLKTVELMLSEYSLNLEPSTLLLVRVFTGVLMVTQARLPT